MRKNPLLERQRGFSLVELILSIAVLAILSGFILQMFLTSAQVNVRADEFDQSTLLCESYIEAALASDDYEAKEIYYDRYWDETKPELATYKLSFAAEQVGDRLETPIYLLDTSGTDVSTSIMWELHSNMVHIKDEREICALTTRQIVQLPDREVALP